jgi:hypothetical protein
MKLTRINVIKLEIILGILSNAVPRWFDQNDPFILRIYFDFQAVSFSLFIHIAILLCENYILKIWLKYAFILSLSNLLDEVIGDPLKLHINEIVIAITSIIYSILLIKKHKKLTNVHTKLCNSN